MNEEKNQTFPCTECQAGHMQRSYLTYFTWIGDELISVPDFPAWICDVCGRREYDLRALNHLNLILNPNAGKPAQRRTASKPRPEVKNPRPKQI